MLVRELMKWYRISNDLSQEEMGKKMKMTKQTYARLEKGETQMNDNKIAAFAGILNKTPKEIREIAEEGKLFQLLEQNENNSDNGSTSSNLIINHNYYGDKELHLEIEYLKNLLAEKDKQLAEKEKVIISQAEQIGTLKARLELSKK